MRSYLHVQGERVMSDTKPKDDKPWNWLWIAGILTVAYAVCLGLLFVKADPGNTIVQHNLNELGDFLAGIFAPLALIWLVAAVFTQRQELNESRKQFHDSQDVIREQMDSIKRQNIMMVEQHNLAQETAKRNYRLSLFERRFQIYDELRQFGEKYVSGYSEDSFSEFDVIRSKAAFVFSREVEEWLDEISNNIHDYYDINSTYLKNHGISDGSGNVVINKVEEIEKELKGIGGWIWEQLITDSLRERLWSSMRVSDD